MGLRATSALAHPSPPCPPPRLTARALFQFPSKGGKAGGEGDHKSRPTGTIPCLRRGLRTVW